MGSELPDKGRGLQSKRIACIIARTKLGPREGQTDHAAPQGIVLPATLRRSRIQEKKR